MDALRVCSNSSSAFKPSRTICVNRSDGGHGGDVLRKEKKKESPKIIRIFILIYLKKIRK